jgi:YesN/AraC family two-component response regulator
MVTACSDYQHLRQSMRCHAIDYIVKPYSIETFKDAIDGFLKQQEKKEEVYGNQKVVQTIKQYIDKNYAEKIKLDDLASLVARDKSYIERLFKKSCNRNIFSYLLQVRIVKAKQFLSKGMCVSETAERVGFDDPAYFGKCFKNFVGCSPQKYKTGW